MAKASDSTNPKVMAMVEAELKKNPSVSVADLQKKATRILKDVAKLTHRQFHARYPLQVKRRKGRAAAKRKKKAAAPTTARRRGRPAGSTTRKASSPRRAAAASASGVDRDAVRAVLLKLAADLSAADERKDVVKVLAGIDRYVDEVAKAAG